MYSGRPVSGKKTWPETLGGSTWLFSLLLPDGLVSSWGGICHSRVTIHLTGGMMWTPAEIDRHYALHSVSSRIADDM